MSSKPFDLGDILSITTGRLFSPRGVTGVYDILNFMTGEEIYTHQIPRACCACSPALRGQHPMLADVTGDGVDSLNWRVWIDAQRAIFGESLPVQPLLSGAYDAMDPIKEAEAMVGAENVIVVRGRPAVPPEADK